MTQTTSNSKSPAVHRYKQTVKKNLHVMAVFFLLSLLGYPAMVSLPLFFDTGWLDYFYQVTFGLFFLISAAVTLTCTIVTAMLVFPYMYKKTEADMLFSLPISRKACFISDFLSGLTLCSVPLILSHIIGLIGFSASVRVIQDAEFFEPYARLRYTRYFDLSSLKATIVPITVLIIMSGIMMYTLSVFSLCAAGNKNRQSAVMLLFTAGIPIAEYAVINTMSADIFGADRSLEYVHMIPYTSPLGGYFFALANMYGFSSFLPSYIKVTVPVMMLAVCVIYTLSAYHIYKKRSAAESGSKFISPVIPFAAVAVTGTAGVFLLVNKELSITAQDNVKIYLNVVFFVICLMICAFAVFISRSRKRTAAFAAAVTAVSFASYGTVRATGNFGADNSVPDTDDIKGISINWQDSFSPVYEVGALRLYEGFFDVTNEPSYQMTYTENKDDITVITDWHRYSVQKHIPEDEAGNSRMITVNYCMNNGSHLVRSYCIDAEGTKILSALDMSEAFREKRADISDYYIDEFMKPLDKADTYTEREDYEKLSDKEKEDREYVVLSSAPIDAHRSDERIYKENHGEQSYDYVLQFDNTTAYRTKKRGELPEDFAQKLKKNVRKDILSETEEQFYDGDNAYVLAFSGALNKIRIPVHYVNTLSYLYECGFENAKEYVFPDFDEFSRNMRSRVYIEDNSSASAAESGYVYTDRYRNQVVNMHMTYTMTEPGFDDSSDEMTKRRYYDLILHSKLNKRPDDDDFVFVLGTYCYVVDDEYRDAAEDLFIELTAERIQEYEMSDHKSEEQTRYFDIIRAEYPEIETYIQENGGKQ